MGKKGVVSDLLRLAYKPKKSLGILGSLKKSRRLTVCVPANFGLFVGGPSGSPSEVAIALPTPGYHIYSLNF